MNMPAKQLAEFQELSHRAKALRHTCVDCEAAREEGSATCARHGLRCVGCNAEGVEEKDAHEYADGIPAYWCRGCLTHEP